MEKVIKRLHFNKHEVDKKRLHFTLASSLFYQRPEHRLFFLALGFGIRTLTNLLDGPIFSSFSFSFYISFLTC